MTDYQREQIARAEDLLTRVYWNMEEDGGTEREKKRLDTILAKLYELDHLE